MRAALLRASRRRQRPRPLVSGQPDSVRRRRGVAERGRAAQRGERDKRSDLDRRLLGRARRARGLHARLVRRGRLVQRAAPSTCALTGKTHRSRRIEAEGLTHWRASRHRGDRGTRMESRWIVVGLLIAWSVVGCGGVADGNGDGQLPPSPAGGSSSRGGASAGAATGGFSSRAGSSGGLNLQRPESSGGAAPNVAVTSPQAGGLPMRDPDLPGVDFEDGSWIQLGSSASSGSFGGFGGGGAPGSNPESTGGAASGAYNSDDPK